jgi:endoglucanase
MAKNKLESTPRIGAAQIKLLERLTNACGVSGDEGEVRAIIKEQVQDYAAEMKVDAMGNLLVTRLGTGEDRLRVMAAAHMDEVGFMLSYNEENGIFRFETLGGMDPRQLAAKPVLVGKERIPGLIGAKPIHLTTPEERKQSLTLESLRIDVGPDNAKAVKVGDRAVFATTFHRAGPSLLAKALDDRMGVATLIELVKHAPANIDLLAAFTVQEEVGLRGARVAAYAFDPDAALILDSTPAYDLPAWDGSENTRYNTRLGAGPAIYLADGATISDPRLARRMLQCAEEAGIPCQVRQPGGGGTDAGAIHKQRMGIPSLSMSVPGRYAHTAVGLARLSDWQHTLALAYTFLARLTRQTLERQD